MLERTHCNIAGVMAVRVERSNASLSIIIHHELQVQATGIKVCGVRSGEHGDHSRPLWLIRTYPPLARSTAESNIWDLEHVIYGNVSLFTLSCVAK
jgi:hypothetical protein